VFRLAVRILQWGKQLAIVACWTSHIIHTQQGEVGPPTALIQELQHQVVQLPYGNPMDIRNLFNYPEENNYMVASSNDEDITNRIIEELRP
jgi:hypothetical protein